MDWDQLRYFLELARAGRLVIAARRLEVQHTTVSRRVQALEKQAGQTLCLRTAEGDASTAAGRHLMPAAEAMERAYTGIQNIEPSVSGQVLSDALSRRQPRPVRQRPSSLRCSSQSTAVSRSGMLHNRARSPISFRNLSRDDTPPGAEGACSPSRPP